MKSEMVIVIVVMMSVMIVADEKLISRTCKRTPDNNLCTAIIGANPGGAEADLAGLGLIVVDAIKQKSNEALSIIYKLTKTGQPNLLPPLRRCTQLYKAVLHADLPLVSHTIRGNPKFAETAVADAAAEATLCDRAFRPKSPPELTNLNKHVTRVAQVARAIIRNLL